MAELKLITLKNKIVADSREVSVMVGKEHKHLLRDIKGYLEVLGKSNFGPADFFIESYYNDEQGKPRPHFYLTKKGCDMVANKMTGEKGVLFTAAYVTKFEEMEKGFYQPKSQAEMLLASVQQLVEQERKVKQLEEQITTVNHRLDNIDKIEILGDLQQRFNAMIRRYTNQEGITYSKAWDEFRNAYNTAYRTNLKVKMKNYQEKHGLKSLTKPQYFSLTGQLEDAIRVADKMLNQNGVLV